MATSPFDQFVFGRSSHLFSFQFQLLGDADYVISDLTSKLDFLRKPRNNRRKPAYSVRKLGWGALMEKQQYTSKRDWSMGTHTNVLGCRSVVPQFFPCIAMLILFCFLKWSRAVSWSGGRQICG